MLRQVQGQELPDEETGGGTVVGGVKAADGGVAAGAGGVEETGVGGGWVIGGGEEVSDWSSVGGTEVGVGGVSDAGGVGVTVAGVVGGAGVVGVEVAPNCPDSIIVRRLCRSRPGNRVWSCDRRVSRFGMFGSPLTCFRRLGAASKPFKESPCQLVNETLLSYEQTCMMTRHLWKAIEAIKACYKAENTVQFAYLTDFHQSCSQAGTALSRYCYLTKLHWI